MNRRSESRNVHRTLGAVKQFRFALLLISAWTVIPTLIIATNYTIEDDRIWRFAFLGIALFSIFILSRFKD